MIVYAPSNCFLSNVLGQLLVFLSDLAVLLFQIVFMQMCILLYYWANKMMMMMMMMVGLRTFELYMQRHVVPWYSDRVYGVVLFRMFNLLPQCCCNMLWALRMCDRRSWYRIPADKLHFHQLSAPSCCLQQHNTMYF